MRLLVGLGNPGPKYEQTRHNAGFIVLDEIASQFGIKLASDARTGGDIGRGQVLEEECILLKPQQFMNLSGRAAAKIMQFYKLKPIDVIVIHDDIDVPSGKVRAREGGGPGGHNGIRSLIQETGSGEFARIKLGVGKPPVVPELGRPAIAVHDWVLQRFSSAELDCLVKVMFPETMQRLKGMFQSRKTT